MRLRRMALAALERYDLEVKRVRLISNDMNGIFRVDTADGLRYVLRVCLPGDAGHTPEEIRSEMMWLAALSRETDLGVPCPLEAGDGGLMVTAEVPGVPEPRHCVVFGWMPGPDLADRLTPENVSRLGELSAALHAHAETFVPPAGFCIRRSDHVFSFGEPVVLFQADHRPLFPPERLACYDYAVRRVQEALDGLYADERGLRVVHNDLHQWNVKVHRGKLYALDFEDLMWGYPAQDIAVTLYYFLGGGNYGALREAFRRGYTRRLPWPERYPGEIDTYMAGRGVMLVNFILQDPNPDYRQIAPEFIERVARRVRDLLPGCPGAG